MSDAAVTLEWTPESKALLRGWSAEAISNSANAINDWLDRMAAWALAQTLRAFDEEQQTGGTRWRPNVGTYGMWKVLMGATKAGTLTGALRRSIAQQVDKTDLSARVGSPLPYAPAVHNGETHPPRIVTAHGPGGNTLTFRSTGQPPRPFLPHEALANAHGVDLFQQLLRRAI